MTIKIMPRDVLRSLPDDATKCAEIKLTMLGTMSVCRGPSCGLRRSLRWLPRCETRWNPKLSKIPATCSPDSLRSPGNRRFEFERHEQDRCGSESKFFQLLVLKRKLKRFAQVRSHVIQRCPLRDNVKLRAFGDIPALVTRTNRRMDSALELHRQILPRVVAGRYSSMC